MSRSFLSLVFLIVATLLLLFWKSIAFQLLHFFSAIYIYFMQTLGLLIHDRSILQVVVVLIVSLLLGLIPVFIYWIFHRRWFYQYMNIVWCVWLVIMTMIMVKRGIV